MAIVIPSVLAERQYSHYTSRLLRLLEPQRQRPDFRSPATPIQNNCSTGGWEEPAATLYVCKSPDNGGLTMIGILILSLSILLAGALPWWPYSAAARLRHHRPWDWLMDAGGIAGEVIVRNDPRRDEPREACETRHPAPTQVPTRRTVAAGAGRDMLVA